MPSPIKSPTLLCSIQLTVSQKSSLKVWNSIAHTNPSKFSSIAVHFTSCHRTKYSLFPLKAFISGELTWQRGGFLSSELSIKASGVMCHCQLALFKGSLCLLSGSITAWAGAFYLGAGEMIQILQNRIIAAGIQIPCQGFFASKSKKGPSQEKQAFLPAIICLTKCI